MNPTLPLAIVPAKGTSIRVPGKNMQTCYGVPTFWHSVTYAREEGVPVVVSTDSREIREYCEAQDCPVHDETVDETSLNNCIRQVMEANPEYDRYVLLQPTSPLRKPGVLRHIIALPARCAYTAEKIKLVGRLEEEGYPARFITQMCTQTARTWHYQFDGSILTGDRRMSEEGVLYLPDAFPVVQEAPYTLQIDTPADLAIMRAVMLISWNNSGR